MQCVCDMTPVCVWHDSLTLENDVHASNNVHVFMHTCAHENGVVTPVWHESSISVAWLTESCMSVAWLIVYVRGMPHLHVWHDPSECPVGWVMPRMKMISCLHILPCTYMDECISTYIYGCIRTWNTCENDFIFAHTSVHTYEWMYIHVYIWMHKDLKYMCRIWMCIHVTNETDVIFAHTSVHIHGWMYIHVYVWMHKNLEYMCRKKNMIGLFCRIQSLL